MVLGYLLFKTVNSTNYKELKILDFNQYCMCCYLVLSNVLLFQAF